MTEKHKYKITILQLKNADNKRNLQNEIRHWGAGIFGSIGNFLVRMFSSNLAKELASTALQAGKTAMKDVEMKAIDVGKTAAINAGKKLVDKATEKLFKPK